MQHEWSEQPAVIAFLFIVHHSHKTTGTMQQAEREFVSCPCSWYIVCLAAIVVVITHD